MASKYARPEVSLKLAIPLSTILVIYAGLAFTGVPRFRDKAGQGVLTNFRQPATNINFINHRLQTAPLWLYQGLHAAPAILWCISIPLQHLAHLRRERLDIHRANGYLALSLSLIQILSGVAFLLWDLAYSHENIYHIHVLRFRGLWIPPFAWPTFKAGLWLYAPVFFYTLLRTVQTARAHEREQHRNWAVLHSICGYAIAINRVNLSFILLFGDLLSLFPRVIRHNWLGLPLRHSDIVTVEISAFAAAAAYAYVVAGVWAIIEMRKGKPIR
ncbi:hypothetical protein BDV23DRAFT_188219 [Aspergillus alliaceus]|uniref:Uncharacterized protein n=1 Tax=Petromyces alliaceus TaxID=209559 RepID=A0A5N7BUQ5_PETAA|nr:hypothetical protein BDV23DRAFT_188219 [Aspergillus alliaceus]